MASIFKRGGKKNRLGNYMIVYRDENGKQRWESAGVPDRDVAQQIANKIEGEVILRRKGIITPDMDRFAENRKVKISKHVEEYLDHCRHEGQDPVHIGNKTTQLNALVTRIGADTLADLDPVRVEKYLQGLVDAKKSHRTHNQHRNTAVSFAAWLVEVGRLPANPLSQLPKKNEAKDRRLVRRAASEEELAALLAVQEAIANGRNVYYLFCALSGLRVKAMRSLTWSDVDFEMGTIRVKVGSAKGKKDDVFFSLHPQIAEELLKIRPHFVRPNDRIFKRIPTIRTFDKDCTRAGIAKLDAEGRQLDRHALRTTHGTRIAKAGITPQLAMRLMGHTDMRTTLKHYTDLRLVDTAKAIASVPSITPKAMEAEVAKATGTDDSPADPMLMNLLAPAQGKMASGGIGSADSTSPMRIGGATGDIQNTRKKQGENTIRQGVASHGLNRASTSPRLPIVRAVGAVG